MHRLGRGLPGYLILFATHAFVSQCQQWSRKPSTPQVFLLISTHFTATPGIRFPLPYSSLAVFGAPSQLSREISHQTYDTTYTLFTPSNSEQRSLPTYYRGCRHVVSRSFFCRYRHYRSCRKSFTPRRASSLTRRRCIRVSPIVQDSPLLPPVGVWPVFQCQCGRVPSQAGYRSLAWWAFTPPTT